MRVQLTLSNSFFLDDVKRTLALAYLFLKVDSKGAYLNDKLIQVSPLHRHSYLLHKISIKILPRRLSKPFSHFFHVQYRELISGFYRTMLCGKRWMEL